MSPVPSRSFAFQARRFGYVALSLGLALAGLGSIFMLLSPPHNAFAQPQKAIIAEPGVASIRYVVPSGTDAGNDCGNSAAPCATVQHAVDMAAPGDEVHVAAGTYTDVQARDGITQMVYISKTATIRGGYTTTNWATFDPSANPTTLDARDQGRVFYITGTPDVRLEGLNITGGNARGLGGVFGGDGGGGLYTANSDNLVVSGCQIYSNTAAYYGGGGGVYGGAAVSGKNFYQRKFGAPGWGGVPGWVGSEGPPRAPPRSRRSSLPASSSSRLMTLPRS